MEPYVGEVRMFGGTFAPQGWQFCDGQLLGIAGNEALYSLLGTLYGGDGVNNFGLPDLRGRVPLHQAGAYPLGQAGGAESVTLNLQQMAVHTHAAAARTANGTLAAPVAHFWAGNAELSCFSSAAPNDTFNAGAIAPTGSGKPHENMMPYLALSFIIATEGIYPTPN